MRMTRANRCFNDLQEDYLKCNWQARELDEFVSAYKVHTCHAYIYIQLDLYHDCDVPIYSCIRIEVEIYVEVNMDYEIMNMQVYISFVRPSANGNEKTVLHKCLCRYT